MNKIISIETDSRFSPGSLVMFSDKFSYPTSFTYLSNNDTIPCLESCVQHVSCYKKRTSKLKRRKGYSRKGSPGPAKSKKMYSGRSSSKITKLMPMSRGKCGVCENGNLQKCNNFFYEPTHQLLIFEKNNTNKEPASGYLPRAKPVLLLEPIKVITSVYKIECDPFTSNLVVNLANKLSPFERQKLKTYFMTFLYKEKIHSLLINRTHYNNELVNALPERM